MDHSALLGRVIVPVAESVPKISAPLIEDSSKIAFLVDEGVVEIHDPRLFRVGREPFCQALAEEAVGPGRARRVEVRFDSGSCRIEFEPGRFDRDILAIRVAETLKAASSRSLDRPFPFEGAEPACGSLTAISSTSGPTIWKTLDAGDGRMIHRRISAVDAPNISQHSGRRLRTKPPRLVRREPPRARSLPAARRLEPSHQRSLSLIELGSKRVVDLALAGGSFVLAVAGIILPGIPSVPFLLLGGHYLIRSSPEFCRRLEGWPGVAGLLRQSQELGALVIDRRSLMKILGVTALTASAFLILHPPLPLVLLLEGGIFAYYGLQEFQNPPHVPKPAQQPALSLA